MESLLFFICLLAVWRITHLFNAEDGPFELIYKFRKLFGNGFFGQVLDCFYCLSIWVSLIPALYFGSNLFEKILYCFAFSGGAILLEKITDKNV